MIQLAAWLTIALLCTVVHAVATVLAEDLLERWHDRRARRRLTAPPP
jgi:hypothetical protein